MVIGESEHGLYLGDGHTKILLPNNQCPDDLLMRDWVEVFVYTDSEDRPVATLEKPYGVVGEFVCLRCVSVTKHGAFLNWGLAKDLFCPMREQEYTMLEGEDYVVRIYRDELTQRVVCSTKLKKFYSKDGGGLEVGQKVKMIVVDFTPHFIAVVIDDKVKGAIFPDEWHERLEYGEVRDAYVKSIREDGRVALSLRPQGFAGALNEKDRLLAALRENGGSLPVSDKSSPEEIQRRFGLSKGSFKKLIGNLYREGVIDIRNDEIRLLG